jgi:hypothetical protein
MKTPLNNIILYSAKKKKAKATPEYSLICPATYSDSASNKSIGGRPTSATHDKIKIKAIGNNA